MFIAPVKLSILSAFMGDRNNLLLTERLVLLHCFYKDFAATRL